MDWYVSSLSDNGNGSEGDPWTLTEAFVAVNDLTVGTGDTIWIKADGTYEGDDSVFVVTRANTPNTEPPIIFSGYGISIGDEVKATIQKNSDTGELIEMANKLYYVLRDLILDGNSRNGRVINSRSVHHIRCEIKNSGNSDGTYYGKFWNCYFHHNAGYGTNRGECYYCISTNNNGGYYAGSHRNCIGYYNTSFNFRATNSSINCISYGGQYGWYDSSTGDIINCVIQGATIVGIKEWVKYALGIRENINFWDCALNTDLVDKLGTYYEVDPQFNNPAGLDFTRTGANLDDIGFSEVGMVSGVDYNINIGIDQTPQTLVVKRVYFPLTIDINKQKPTITIRPIRKQIHINVEREE